MVEIDTFYNNPSKFDEKRCVSVEIIVISLNYDGYCDLKICEQKLCRSIIIKYRVVIKTLFKCC